ncbi:ABC transporter substrate-binding protein [Pseudonocardia pini]|uniref:ABC transporter substrate-binding protein n=1 Tax=Pseudonocardia pini TaxID=2758030 RepID=UPI0015F0EE5C|nr:ABC transporter substrate-binding protein [Pseudonocardia pini]
MRRRWGRLVAAAGALAVVVATAACTAPAADGPGRPPPAADTPVDPNGSLTVGTVTVPTGFDPHRERTGGERPYTFLVFDRLTRLDGALRAAPMLAEGWELAPDGRSLTVRLRPGVSFHDGTPFDAAAVRANIQRAKTIEGSTSADELAAVAGVEVLDPATVRFDLTAPTPELPELLAGPAGAMISPRALADPTVDLLKDPRDAGTGPYRVAEFVPNEHAVFTRAADTNWDPGAGRLAQLEVRFVSDDRTRDSALRAGELDVAYVNPLAANAIKQAEALGRGGGFVYYRFPTGVLNAMLLRSTVLTDPRVREAVMRAVDRDPIVRGLLQGTCVRSDQLAREGFPGHIADFTDPYPYDPEESRRLLAEAGLVGGMDLDISFITGRQAIPQVLQQQLAAVGITASLTPLTSIEVLSAYRQDQLASWNYQVAPELSPGATTDFVLSPAGVGGRSERVAAAARTARQTIDPTAREQGYEQTNRLIADEAFFVPVCHLDAHFVATDQVVGFDTAPVAYAQYMLDLRYVARAAEEVR